MERIIGIDLGTTNSVVAVMEAGQPKVITNADGARLTPSVIAFTQDGEKLVGTTAKRQAVTNPKNTVFSIKRFMGRRYSEVTEERKRVPYEVLGDGEEPVKVKVGGKVQTPPEISAMILANLKKAAEDYLGEKITAAVITVPAYFNDTQRQATKDAGRIAGLNVKRIINEPTAAALAYGLDKKKNEKIAVFDLGGGTFDISILEVGDGVFEVKSTNGDTHLGGDNFDEVLIDWLADTFKKEEGVDLRKDQMALQRLKEAAEKAKCELSTMLQTDINLPFITATASGPKHLSKKLTRAHFEQLIKNLAERTRKPCLQALEDAGLTPVQIDEVVLVGGSTRIPLIQEIVREIFNKTPHKGVNPDEVVAVGAAIQGGILGGDKNLKDILLLDVTPLSLGIETLGGVMTTLIPRNSTIPTEKKEVFSTAEDNQPGVDVHVLQGERSMAKDNRTLGRFRLDGIPPAPRGTPQIEVSFRIDANGILNVSARDLGSGMEQSVVIQSSSGISEEEIHRMRSEAQRHSEEDKKQRELIDLRNQADHLMHSMETTIREYGNRASADLLARIERDKQTLKKAKEGSDAGKIRQALENFQQSCQELGKLMYSNTGSTTQQQAYHEQQHAQQKDNSNDVIDAEFEVKS